MSIGGSEQFALPLLAPQLRTVEVYLGWFGPASGMVHATSGVMSLVGGSASRAHRGLGILADYATRRVPAAPAPRGAGGRGRARCRGGRSTARAPCWRATRLRSQDAYALTAELLAWGAGRAAEHGVIGVGALDAVAALRPGRGREGRGGGGDRRRGVISPRLRGVRRRPRVEISPVGAIRMGEPSISPLASLIRRLVIALGALVVTALIVFFGRDGYKDANGAAPLSLADAFYYATVSVSTTGYGDIVPVTDTARLITTVVITPLRLIFLITFVGTTVELLTERSRQSFRIQRWRSRVRDHTVVVGYGTKGRAAVETLLGDGADRTAIVVVDTERAQLDAAAALGLVTVTGNATRSSVLRSGGRPRGQSDRGGDQPRRHRRTGDADGATAGARHPHRRVGARVGERASPAPVGGQLGDRLGGDGGQASGRRDDHAAWSSRSSRTC